jgi:hypothetical protein
MKDRPWNSLKSAYCSYLPRDKRVVRAPLRAGCRRMREKGRYRCLPLERKDPRRRLVLLLMDKVVFLMGSLFLLCAGGG